ncbi:MAG: hypothetical protein IT366_16785 [Candidatus Hydrogenedentes bacterium]|nr:hypothetical protein [Candidatus Hydrogenedentota bacterium]
MDNIGEVIFAVMALLFAVFAGIKRFFEGKDVERRSRESDWTADDLPEETRRMLFGEPAATTARPAQPKHNPDPFVEARDIFKEVRRQIEVQTARPKQGAPRPQAPPPVPQQSAPMARPAHPQQPQFRPQQQPQRSPQPQRPPSQPRHVQTQRPVAPPAQPPRMVPQQSQGAMQRQQQTDERRYAQQQRRQPTRPVVPLREPDEGPTMPVSRARQERPRAKPIRRRGHWIAGPEDLRRGIVLSEILGPPRAMREHEI